MKKLLPIFTILLLSGCTDARDVALQDQYCSDKGGVFEYSSNSILGFGYCKDNTGFKWSDVKHLKLRPEFYPKEK